MGKKWKQWQIFFSWAIKSLWMVTAAMKLKDAPWQKSNGKPRKHVKKQRHHFADKGPSSQSYGFSSSNVRMWESDHKEGWLPKNWCFQTVVLKKILESPLDSMKVKPINPKGDQPWIFIGRTDAEALILWPPDEKRRLIGKDPNAGKDWGQEEKGATEDEWLNESGDERMRWVICQHHQLPESTQAHVHHPLSSPSPPTLNLSQHQGLFPWVSSLYQVAKVLEFQLQYQSFQWTPRIDLL